MRYAFILPPGRFTVRTRFSRRALSGTGDGKCSARYHASMLETAVERARKIHLIIFDVDGVLTDGGIWLFPAPAGPSVPESRAPETLGARIADRLSEHADRIDQGGGYGIHSANMVEAKGFNAQDGLGISLARLAGMKCGIITKRISETVALRARDLRLEYVYMGQSHKMDAVRDILAKEQIKLEEIAYVGDDIIDLPVMRVCGLAIAVANARKEVKAAAHYVTPSNGGHGAGRDAIEFILEAKGIMDSVIERYLDERNPMPASMDIGQGGI